MSEESDQLLRAIHDELRGREPAIVGPLELKGDALTARDGQLTLQARFRSDPGYHPSIAHFHVVAKIGQNSLGDPLDACVMGVHADRRQGVKLAAKNWVTNVGSTVLSLTHARPVMGAAHFGGADPWGVPGCHGFVGPVFGYNSVIDAAQIKNAGLFDAAAAMAPPGRLHLAKSVLAAQDDQTWTRTLEIDGHAADFEEKKWERGIPVQTNAVVSQFAVFRFYDQPDAVKTRQRLDDCIRRFVAAFATTKDVDAASRILLGENFEADVVNRVETFAPPAFFRVLFAGIGARFSAEYVRIKRDGTGETRKIMCEPAFARSAVLCRELAAGEFAESVKGLAACSSTFNVINTAMKKGSKPASLKLGPAIIPDPGVDAAAIQKAIQEMRASMQAGARPAPAPEPATPPKVQKPWWKRW